MKKDISQINVKFDAVDIAKSCITASSPRQTEKDVWANRGANSV